VQVFFVLILCCLFWHTEAPAAEIPVTVNEGASGSGMSSVVDGENMIPCEVHFSVYRFSSFSKNIHFVCHCFTEMPTTSQKKKRVWIGDAEGLKKHAEKKRKYHRYDLRSTKPAPDMMPRERLGTTDSQFIQYAPKNNMEVCLPFPRSGEKKVFLMRRFIVEECVRANEDGTYAIKWEPEINVSGPSVDLDERKIISAKFHLSMGYGDYQASYTNGVFPVKASFVLRKGLMKKGNPFALPLDYPTFQLLLEEGRKLILFVEKTLRGKSFTSLAEMKLPEAVILHTLPEVVKDRSGKVISQKNLLTMLNVQFRNWTGRRGKVQPSFNVRQWLEADGQLTALKGGCTMNFREFYSLIHCAAEYLMASEEAIAQLRIFHDQLRNSLETKLVCSTYPEWVGRDYDGESFLVDDESDCPNGDSDSDDVDERIDAPNALIVAEMQHELRLSDAVDEKEHVPASDEDVGGFL
jgi:hypothetical protein